MFVCSWYLVFFNSISLIKPKSFDTIIIKHTDIKKRDNTAEQNKEILWRSKCLIYKKISSNKGAVILCDDYEDATYIIGVKKAVDKFVEENKLK